MLPNELLRSLALLAIERQIDARLRFVARPAPREVFSALTRAASRLGCWSAAVVWGSNTTPLNAILNLTINYCLPLPFNMK
jgi:hypothetical protein